MCCELVVVGYYFEVVNCCFVVWCCGQMGSDWIFCQGVSVDYFWREFGQCCFLCGGCGSLQMVIVWCIEVFCQFVVMFLWVFFGYCGDFCCQQVYDDVVFIGGLWCVVEVQEGGFGVFFVVEVEVVIEQVVDKLFKVYWYFYQFVVQIVYYVVNYCGGDQCFIYCYFFVLLWMMLEQVVDCYCQVVVWVY